MQLLNKTISMRLKPEDVHALTIIALDPTGELADRLLVTLTGKLLEVAEAMRKKTDQRLLADDIRSAVIDLERWSNPSHSKRAQTHGR